LLVGLDEWDFQLTKQSVLLKGMASAMPMIALIFVDSHPMIASRSWDAETVCR
jgi:hypothetical protein